MDIIILLCRSARKNFFKVIKLKRKKKRDVYVYTSIYEVAET